MLAETYAFTNATPVMFISLEGHSSNEEACNPKPGRKVNQHNSTSEKITDENGSQKQSFAKQ